MGEAAKLMVHLTAEDVEALMRRVVREELKHVTQPASESELLTTTEAAAFCKMGRRTLLWHVAEGRLVPDAPARPGFKTHRFKRATLETFLAKL